MKDESKGAELFDAVFEKAVLLDFENELAEVPIRKTAERDHAFSTRHIAKMRRLFESAARGERRRTMRRFAGTCAASLVLATALLFGSLMFFSPQVRATVVKVIVEWFDRFTMFQTTEEAETELGKWRPAFLPGGYREEEAELGVDMGSVVYRNREGERIVLVFARGSNTISVDNEGFAYRTAVSDETEYRLFESETDGKDNAVVWNKAGCAFYLTSGLPVEELLEVAVSVREEK
jgi:hypothetical protein